VGRRPATLRAIGATIGQGVLIRHRVRIHWPWKLTIGDHSWVGEGAWLLTLEPIHIGRNACVAEDALLYTGSHDRRSKTFEFDVISEQEEELVTSISELLANPSRRHEMGELERRLVEESNSISAVGDELQEIYENARVNNQAYA
jgi:carbonic anhydrase/acetyltransferase-like protein (isoleucine patch superfamily)